ncbi:MAG: heparinase II/III family protein [Candidatus Glassbacteria bacterium]
MLAELIEGKGRFVEEIVNGLWLILEESSWVLPAHLGLQRAGSGLPDVAEPVVDLFSAETVSLVAWTVYLVGDRLDEVSPLIRARCVDEANRRVLNPCFERNDFWWLGFTGDHINNWNPWCNSNWLTANLLLERDGGRRIEAVAKSTRSLDRFIASYRPDGGCDEGPSYWGRAGASLFDCLELLYSATGGKIDVYDYPLIRNMGRYIYRAHIDDRYFINFADAPAKVGIDGDLIYRYGKRIADPNLVSLGAWAASASLKQGPATERDLGHCLPGLTIIGELAAANGNPPYVRDAWLDGIQVMAARSREGSAQGLYLAAKGGHNAESHNHNDVGNFIVYYDGLPVLVDAGVGEYTRQTFSDQRYEIWTMQSAYHNLPTINGVMQHEGREYAAKEVSYQADRSSARFSLDIADTYPQAAGVQSWQRTLKLERGSRVSLEEKFRLSRREGGLMLSLMTPCAADLSRPGEIHLNLTGKNNERIDLKLVYPAGKLQARCERISLDDQRLTSAWGDHLNRIMLSAPAGSPPADTWKLSLSR